MACWLDFNFSVRHADPATQHVLVHGALGFVAVLLHGFSFAIFAKLMNHPRLKEFDEFLRTDSFAARQG